MRQVQRALVALVAFVAVLTALVGLPLTRVAAAPAVSATLAAREDLEVQTILDINAARGQRGLQPLYADGTLGAVARDRSFDMAEHNYFSHYAPDGSMIFVRLLAARQISFSYAGENLAWNTYTDDVSAHAAVEGWIASPPHADNLFGRAYSRAGVGVVSADAKKYFTVIFVGD